MIAYWSPSPYFFAEIIGLTVNDNLVHEKSLICLFFEDYSISLKVNGIYMQSCGCIDFLRTRSGMSPGMALGFFWALGGLFFQGLFLPLQRYIMICGRTKRIISIFSRPCQGGSTYRGAIRNFGRKMVCIYLLLTHLHTNVTGDNVQSRSSAFLLDGFRFR